jgi:hypothetical protein
MARITSDIAACCSTSFGHLLLQLGTQRNTAALGSAARLVLSVMRSRFIALTVCRKALRSQPRRPIKRRFRIP